MLAKEEYTRNSNATYAGRKIYGFGAEPTPLDCMAPEAKGIGRFPEREQKAAEVKEDKAKRLREMRAFLKSAVADVDRRIATARGHRTAR